MKYELTFFICLTYITYNYNSLLLKHIYITLLTFFQSLRSKLRQKDEIIQKLINDLDKYKNDPQNNTKSVLRRADTTNLADSIKFKQVSNLSKEDTQFALTERGEVCQTERNTVNTKLGGVVTNNKNSSGNTPNVYISNQGNRFANPSNAKVLFNSGNKKK